MLSWKKTFYLFIVVVLLAVGCGNSDSESMPMVNPSTSQAYIIPEQVPAYPESTGQLLVYPDFLDDGISNSLPEIEVDCLHAQGSHKVIELGNGIYSVDISSDGEPWKGRCEVAVNGTALDSMPIFNAKSLCETKVPDSENPRYHDLAAAFSPVIFQDIGRWPEADKITAFDYDGNLAGNDNWDNLDQSDEVAVVYYSAIETRTHLFLTYSVYHPLRYGTFVENTTESHENSMTGMLVVLEKSQYGYDFLLLETFFDRQFLIYSDSEKVDSKIEKVFPTVIFEQSTHPAVFVESQSHGMLVDAPFVIGEYLGQEDTDFPGGDGIVYRYDPQATAPQSNNDRNAGYDLVPVLETLWAKRALIGNGQTYDAPYSLYPNCMVPGRFDGDDFQEDAASPPWGWDDIDDGSVRRGEWFFFPAHAVSKHVSIKSEFSLQYTYNPYLGVY